jgi:hypothetical protein
MPDSPAVPGDEPYGVVLMVGRGSACRAGICEQAGMNQARRAGRVRQRGARRTRPARLSDDAQEVSRRLSIG